MVGMWLIFIGWHQMSGEDMLILLSWHQMSDEDVLPGIR